MASQELTSRFSTYFDEMAACQAAGCYLALLYLVVVLPDICAALESRDGETDGNKYKKWCEKFLAASGLSPIERWEMRCALLHQGTTLTDSRKPGRYATYSFMPPSGDDIHFRVSTDGENNLTLDVSKLAGEMRAAVRLWADHLLLSANTKQLEIVKLNLQSLLRKQPKTIPGQGPLPPTFSSTG